MANSATPWTVARQVSLSFTSSRCLLKLKSIKLGMPSNHSVLYSLLLLLPSIFPSVRVFSNEVALCIKWPKYWSFSFSPPNECSGLISFRIDWFDLRAFQGTLKSLPQHRINSSALSFLYSPPLTSIHDYWKTIALTTPTFVGKVMFLLFNTLYRFVIVFLPRRKQNHCRW